MPQQKQNARQTLVEFALPHVPFDGWSDDTFKAAVQDSAMDMAAARALCPRGAVDLAIEAHRMGDAELERRLADADLGALRFSERVTLAVRIRLEATPDKETVRRATTLFALPHNAPEGGKLIWNTCDLIWRALGDTSDDVNWYTKRATLSGVYSATVLFWLGDTSPDDQDTWAFLERRIDNVMQFEKLKASVRKNPVVSKLLAGPARLLAGIKAPAPFDGADLPGRWQAPVNTSPKD